MVAAFDSPVTRQLDELGVDYRVIEIPLDADKKPVRALEELLSACGQEPGQVVRSLLLRTGSGRFVLLAVAGGKRVDWAALRQYLGERRLAMAESEQVLATTGYPIGAVPPLALPQEVRVLVDESVFAYARVVIGSGVLGYALDLASCDLRRALPGAEVGKFA